MGLWDQILRPESVNQTAWIWDGDDYRRHAYGDSYATARHVAAALQARGVQRGEVVAAIITNSADSVSGFLGAWWAGARVASLPIIARGQSLEDYMAALRRMCAAIDARFLLFEDRFAQVLLAQGFGNEPEIIAYEQLSGFPGRAEVEPLEPDEVIFIQFSSGTTAAPRGVELTARAIDAQLRLLAERMEIDPARDVGAMWLPLSHDMGFFAGNIMVWYTGMHGVLSSPERFLAQPWTWFEDCSRFGATITVGPSFAYHVAGRTRGSRTLPAPLTLRLCVTGGEVVVGSHLRGCVNAFAGDGLTLTPFVPAYGMAEATLGVSTGSPSSEPRSLWVRSEGLFDGELALCDEGDPGARELVSCGATLPGFSVAYDGTVGELRVDGPSLGLGYHRAPELTAERFTDGGLLTGDVGFVHEGELYVAGRLDDRLIVAGRNIDVADLELEISEDSGVRKGNCAVVDVRRGDSQKIVLVAELDSETTPDALLGYVREVAARRHGLRIDQLVTVDRGQFPKTPSGKAQRYRCRELAQTAMR